jgi:hypothetical protein
MGGVMKRMFRSAAAALIAAIFIWGSAGSAQAFEGLEDRFDVHGYAHQTFLLSNENSNHFLGADHHGSFENNALALLLSFKSTEDLTIWAQLYADNESKFRLDWAFADYRLTDWLRVRGGQIKTPLGLLNEIRDVKYLHVSALEPYIYQESAGIMFESFRGASALLEHELVGGALHLDLFGGTPVFFEGQEALEKHYGLIGGRLQYETPINGLILGGTIAHCRETETANNTEVNGTKTIVGGSLEYTYAGLKLSSEYFQVQGVNPKAYGYYAEAGYTFFDQLTPFVRYDYVTTNRDDKANPLYYQDSIGFGVGYRFNKFAAIKMEDHIVTGFGMPAKEFGEENDINTFEGKKHWNLFAVSLNLMF